MNIKSIVGVAFLYATTSSVCVGASGTLCEAMQMGAFDVVQSMVLKGCDSKEYEAVGLTPLHLATIKDDETFITDVLRSIITTKDNVVMLAADSNGWKPFHWAVFLGKTKLASWLYGACRDVISVSDCRGNLPLHIALMGKGKFNPTHIHFLIGRGAAMDIQNQDQIAPAHMAVKNGNQGVIDLFYNHGSAVAKLLVDQQKIGKPLFITRCDCVAIMADSK